MQDLIFVAIVVAFFALAVGFVKVCDHIIGPDEVVQPSVTSELEDVAS